jgi:antitoxin component of MazEF toxin-antitoxin module
MKMRIKTTGFQVGGSYCVRIPPAFVEHFKLSMENGDDFYIEDEKTKDGESQIVLKTVQRRLKVD